MSVNPSDQQVVDLNTSGRIAVGYDCMWKLMHNRPASRSCARRAITVLLLALTLMLSAGNAVHLLIHKDAAAPGHDCAFVHWARGEAGFAQSFAGLPSVKITCTEQTPPVFTIFLSPAYTVLQYSRGPPLV